MAAKTRLRRALLLLTLLPSLAAASPPFEAVGERHNIDPLLLKAVASVESKVNPYAMNLDGESIYCTSREEAVEGFRYVQAHPWLLKIPQGSVAEYFEFSGDPNCVLVSEHYDRIWFSKRSVAEAFAKRHGLNGEIRKANTHKVAFGLMQIYWPAHGETVKDWEQLFDPRFNLEYAARYLASLAERHGPILAIGYYHTGSGNTDFRVARARWYRDEVLPRYLTYLSTVEQ